MVFKIVCSYCGEDMGTKEAPGNSVAESIEAMGLENVSHSICPDCYRKQMEIIEGRHSGGFENEKL